MASDGRDVHHHARRFGLDHVRGDLARHHGRADEVHVEHSAELLGRKLHDLPRAATLLHQEPVADDAGVVDEPVEAAHRVGRPRDEGGDASLVAHVEHPSMDACVEAGEALGVHVPDGDLRPRSMETLGEVTAHARRAARDDDLELFELHDDP